ncbi:Zinc finger protein ZPR1 [Lamellibrachia satsuma]|nr:Zinc finger protein ZPR1 [Lamellibrachia satsuma]
MSGDAQNPSGSAGDRAGSLFPSLSGEMEGDEGITEMESLCLQCYGQGKTILMLTKVPFFKEVIISSFECNKCGYHDNSIQSGSKIQDKGAKYTITIETSRDLNRQVVKSDTATFHIPSLEFEQPPSKKGEITTVEGLVDSVINGLQMFQPQRREQDAETASKVAAFILRLQKLKTLEKPFEIILDDPSGNSFIENPDAPKKDEGATVLHYTRSKEQNQLLGLSEESEAHQPDGTAPGSFEAKAGSQDLNLKNEVLIFKTNCPDCNAPCDTNMKVVDIPYFKQVVIMATVCDACGHRDNEVKGGSGIEPKGTCIKLKLTKEEDLSRDVLKSDTCGVRIPELELELVEGTLGGRFTTVEGLILSIKEQLGSHNPFLIGDSSSQDVKGRIKEFCKKLDKIAKGEMLNIHLILDDPAGNSYLQNPFAPDPDLHMEVTLYERNFEQNELLGLNDMKTENYTSEDT